MQFGFAGAITADRVDVHARTNHVVGQDRGVLLVRRAGGDDLRAFHRLFPRFAHHDFQIAARQVACGLFRRRLVDVIQAHGIDTADRLESEALEFRLGTVADHRHGCGALRCKMARCHRRSSGGAQGGQQGHFGEKFGITCVHICKKAEGGDCLQTVLRVLGVAVDIFEPVHLTIRCRHQFNDAHVRMAGHTGRFVEHLPALEIGFNLIGEIAQHPLYTEVVNEAHHVFD